MVAWVKSAGPAKDQKIVSNQDNVSGGYKLSIYNDKPEFEIRDSGNTPATSRFSEGGTALEPGVWHHVVGTYHQGGSLKVYVDGKLERESPTPSILTASAGALMIGREPFGKMYWFNGLLDDLQIYNYPLSDTQVAALYSGQTPPVIAQIRAVETGTRGKSNNWIPVTIIVIVALGAGLAARRKSTTA